MLTVLELPKRFDRHKHEIKQMSHEALNAMARYYGIEERK